jgi:Methyltransferase domain
MRAPGPEAVFRVSPPESATSEARDNPLAEYFFRNPGRQIHKWHHYFEIYHRHFARFRGRAPVVVEIGVQHGGSLQMWRHYFGDGVRIVGIDVDERCRGLADDGTTILIGDQADRRFLAGVREQFPHVDIVIDDGGHTTQQQIATLEELYPHVQPRGVYVCEDLHTSYQPHWGGGLGRPGTFIELAKLLVDRLHAWYYMAPGEPMDDFALGAHSLSFYDSMLVIEKRPILQPRNSMVGQPSF